MTTLFLRFPSEASWLEACQTAGFWVIDPLDGDRPLLLSHDHIFDVMGPIDVPGTYHPEPGDELTPPIYIPGWHVNAKLPELPPGWEAFTIAPTNPHRTFAGDQP